MSKPTVFVLVYASDPITATFLSYEVTLNLNPVILKTEERLPKSWLMPEPAWSLQDFATQCQNDPAMTKGAFIIYDVENDQGNFNFVAITNTYAHLYAKALYIDCKPFSPPFRSESNGITTYTQQGTYTGTPPTPSPMPACVNEPGSCPSVVTYAPSSSTSTQTQTSYPSPRPKDDDNKAKTPYPTQRVVVTRSSGANSTSITSVYPSPGPAPTSKPKPGAPKPTPTPTESPYTSGQSTTVNVAANSAAQYQGTESTSVIPTMSVLWTSTGELDSAHFAANQYGIPFVTVAALGAYFASRSYQQTSSITTTEPLIPGQTTSQGSTAVSLQRQGNNSALPYGLAYLGSSLSNLGTLTFGGTNQTRVLKSAAASVASALRRELDRYCYLHTKWNGVHRSGTPKSTGQTPEMCGLFTEDL